jgi:hypothetical protein
MLWNYLRGSAVDLINNLLAATAFYEEVDETGETKNTGFNFWLDLPETYTGTVNIQLYGIQ